MKIRNILTLILTWGVFSLYAQDYIVDIEHYNLVNGLETRNIQTAFKDSKNYMWFSSNMGVYQFDGYEFKKFSYTKDDTPFSAVHLLEDNQNNLWIIRSSVPRSLAWYVIPSGQNSIIPLAEFFDDLVPFPLQELYRIETTNTGEIVLINSNHEGYVFDGQKFEKIFDIQQLGESEILETEPIYIQRDSNDVIWILYLKNLHQKLPNGNLEKRKTFAEFQNFKINKNNEFIFWKTYNHSENSITIMDDGDSLLTSTSVAFNDYIKRPFLDLNSTPEQPYFIASHSRRTFDFSLFNFETKEVIDFSEYDLDLKDIYISSVFVENDHTIWVCSFEGIIKINFQKNPFSHFLKSKSSRGIVRASEDNIWVGTYSGFYEVNTSNGFQERNLENIGTYILGILKDNKGKIWCGSHGSLAYIFDPSEPLKTFSSPRYVSGDGVRDNFHTIFQDEQNDTYWVGTQKGFSKYNVELDSFVRYKNTNGFDFVHNHEVRDFEISKNNQELLIASSKGIFVLNHKKGITRHFSKSDNTLPFDYINYIHTDKQDGTLWLGTAYGGLIHWDYPDGTPIQITKEDGLTDNMIYSIHEDDAGYLWLPSNNGLMQYNKKDGAVITYTTEDGIAHNEFNYHSNFQDDDGTIYLGGLNGVTSFHPDSIQLSKEDNFVSLTDIQTPNFETGTINSIFDDFKKQKAIQFDSDERSVIFSFALLNYDTPSKNKFAYKIVGKDSLWQPVEGRSIRFNGLPYGEYNIIVKGQNSKGQWSSEVLKIPIQIVKPFYNSWLFRTLLALIIIVGATKFISNRRNYFLRKRNQELEAEVARRTEKIQKDKEVIEKQAAELQKLDESKNQFFANVTHELRTPLSLIIGPLQHIMKTSPLDAVTIKKLEEVVGNGDALKELIEEILDLTRHDLKKIKIVKEPVHFFSLIRKWTSGFDLEGQQRDIDFQLYYQLPIDINLILDAKKIKKIVTNLLSNAFKFCKSGDNIQLVLLEENNNIVIKVKDTGQGIAQDDLSNIFQRFYQAKQKESQLIGGMGIGLSLSKELAELMNGSLEVESVLGKGSTFIFTFPKEETTKQEIQQEKIENLINDVNNKPAIIDISKPSILIVEDTLKMRNFIQNLLQPMANIYLANNGKKALEILLEGEKIDLIVSDIMMPEMDGFVLLEKLKASTQWQLIPVIMLTALTDDSRKIKALTIGVDDYLTKPFLAEELIARAQTLLQNVKSRKSAVEEILVLENTKEEVKLEMVDSADKKWIKELEKLAFEKVTTPNFKISQLAKEVALGERQLHRRLKKITGLTPGSYLKEIRLQKARQLLENKAYRTVAEIAYLVGFNTPQYFSNIYKERFGKAPSEYLRDS